MSQEQPANKKRSLDNLKEDNADVSAISREAKQGKIAQKEKNKDKDNSNSMENDNDNDNKNEMDYDMWAMWDVLRHYVDIGEDGDDAPIDIKKVLMIKDGDEMKSQVTVAGLEGLAALKDKDKDNLPYKIFTGKDLCRFHIVPQFPQTRAKDEEMQLHLRPPNLGPPPKQELSQEEKKLLSEYMVDKNGDVTENNMDWEKWKRAGAQLPLECLKLLPKIPRNPPRNPAKKCEVIVHKNVNTMTGYECFGIDEFVPAFTNLLEKSESFLEKDSEEAIKIYIFEYNDDENDDKCYHIINFIPK